MSRGSDIALDSSILYLQYLNTAGWYSAAQRNVTSGKMIIGLEMSFVTAAMSRLVSCIYRPSPRSFSFLRALCLERSRESFLLSFGSAEDTDRILIRKTVAHRIKKQLYENNLQKYSTMII